MVNDSGLFETITEELSSLDEQKSPTPTPYNLNFFKILGLSEKELIHSRFINFLLDPNEKDGHCYKDDFLKLFIKMLNIKMSEKNITEIPIPYDDFKSVNVKPEAPTEEGRFIDILIEINKEYYIVIENKIDAMDQRRQLKDYNEDIYEKYKKKFGKKYEKKPALVYLTLNGKKASKRSLGDLTENDYIQLSYMKDIIDWIKKCINFVIGENPNDTKMLFLLTEYLAMVEMLTMKFTKLEKIWEILEKKWEVLEKKKEILEEAFDICEKVNKIVPEFDFNRQLKAYIIRTRFIEGIGGKPTFIPFIQKLCNKIEGLEWEIIEGKHITDKGWGFQFYKDDEKWKKSNIKIEYRFETKILRNCVFGVRDHTPAKGNWFQMPRKYRNWLKDVFGELIDENYESKAGGLFSVLKEQIEEMIRKIEGS
jgi:hypothetical protein